MLFKNTSVWTAVTGLGGSGGTAWYVRPAGGSYGAEDGTTYDTAWDGFANIDWTAAGVLPGDTLYICGTHDEMLTIGASGAVGLPIKVRGDYPSDLGTIDGGDSINICLSIPSKDYITVSAISLIDASISCSEVSGTSSSVIFNEVTASGSGNQAYQHLNTSETSYTNCIATDCFDDGYSGHDSAVVSITGGTVSFCDQGVNLIGLSAITVQDVVFTSNTSYDMFISATHTNATLDATNCVFNSPVVYTNGIGTLTGCRFNVPAKFEVDAVVELHRCLFDGTGGTAHLLEVLGTVDISYCIFTNMPTNRYGMAIRSAAVSTVSNCTFYGSGRGIFATEDVTVNNLILRSLALGLLADASDTITAQNCSFYANGVDTSGTVVQTASQTGDPDMVDPGNEDFSLGGASTIIGDGLDLGASYETGIDTADWGDSGTVPVVTTKTQTGSWDIGAHIS